MCYRELHSIAGQCSKALKLWFLIAAVTGTIIGQCSEGGSGGKNHYTITDQFGERITISFSILGLGSALLRVAVVGALR
jgi:hypothetical protein